MKLKIKLMINTICKTEFAIEMAGNPLSFLKK